jgi:hypothetical protein
MFESHLENHLDHVVVYTDARGIGGAEISLGHLIAAVSSKWRITIIGVCPEVVEMLSSCRPRVGQIVLSDQGAAALIQHWFTFQRLHPQIIHFNCCTPWANAVGLIAAMLLSVFQSHPKIIRVDQLPLRTTDALALWRTRALCLRVDAHVAVGQASARRMEDFYALGRNSVISIPNGVPELDTNVTAPHLLTRWQKRS